MLPISVLYAFSLRFFFMFMWSGSGLSLMGFARCERNMFVKMLHLITDALFSSRGLKFSYMLILLVGFRFRFLRSSSSLRRHRSCPALFVVSVLSLFHVHED